MAKPDNDRIIEALLFASDKPLPVQLLAQVLELPHKEVTAAVEQLAVRLKETDAPVTLKEIAGGYELLTLPDYAPYIKKLYKNKLMSRLTRAALEVLAIVAYKQPITKQEVEIIRGVNSDGVYHTLLERKLIKIAGRKDAPGRPLLYGTTKEFMQYLGINTLDDLPKLDEIKTILEKDEYIEKWEDKIEVAKNQTMMNFDEEEKQKLMHRQSTEDMLAEGGAPLTEEENAQPQEEEEKNVLDEELIPETLEDEDEDEYEDEDEEDDDDDDEEEDDDDEDEEDDDDEDGK